MGVWNYATPDLDNGGGVSHRMKIMGLIDERITQTQLLHWNEIYLGYLYLL